MRAAILSLLALALAACQTAPVESDDCDHIADVCRPYQSTAGQAHDCYALATNPNTPDSTCEDQLSACLAACPSSAPDN